jgi:hypothetical protein
MSLQETSDKPKLYHIVWVDSYLKIPVEDLTNAFPNISRDEIISIDIKKLEISRQKLQNQFPYDHFIIQERKVREY